MSLPRMKSILWMELMPSERPPVKCKCFSFKYKGLLKQKFTLPDRFPPLHPTHKPPSLRCTAIFFFPPFICLLFLSFHAAWFYSDCSPVIRLSKWHQRSWVPLGKGDVDIPRGSGSIHSLKKERAGLAAHHREGMSVPSDDIPKDVGMGPEWRLQRRGSHRDNAGSTEWVSSCAEYLIR